MAKGPCERYFPDLSAYADETLPPKRWEQVSYHLAGCERCRDEVAAISSVCSTLGSSRRSAAPETLAAKLESIAGEHAATPLYMAAGSGALPTARKRRARRAAQGGVALLAVMVSTIVLATLVAPGPTKLTDPIKAARMQFSRSLSAISVNEAVGAVLLAHERDADFGVPESYDPRLAETRSVSISADEAASVLRRAADTDLNLTGVQRVWVSDGRQGYHVADVRTTRVVGYGAQLEVLDVRGNRFSSSFLPDIGARLVEAPPEWAYVRSATVEQIAGRDTIRVQANDGDHPAARWWVDAETGLMMWTERYDAHGRVSLAVGYRELKLDAAGFDQDAATQLISLQPASSSEAEGWCVGFERCPLELAGVPLVAHASSEGSMTLVYSDGFDTAVVGWTQGVLGDGALAQTDRASGKASVEVWQSGGAVISVTCNCSADELSALMAELPGQQPYQRSLPRQILDGLGRLAPGR
ncbi:MAG: hypothetical protein Q4F67_13665 [Propionibacteriaceae bacterium]|nr:hypothetical protein [Propionibacteriaceae bacterium]